MLNRKLRRLTAGSLLLLTACEGGVGVLAPWKEPSISAQRARAFSAEDLFRGLLFSDGPAAGAIPELRKVGTISDRVKDPASLNKVRAFQNRLIARIRADDARFFATFESEMRSGSPVRVEAALKRAGAVAYRVTVNSPEVNQIRAEFKKNPELKQKLLGAAREQREAAKKASGSTSKPAIAAASSAPAAPAQPSRSISTSATPDVQEHDPFDVMIAALLDSDGEPGEIAGWFIGPTFLVSVVWVLVYAQLAVAQDIAVILNLYGAMNVQLMAFYDTYFWSVSGGFIEVSPDRCVYNEQLIGYEDQWYPIEPCGMIPYYSGSSVPYEQMIYSIATTFAT